MHATTRILVSILLTTALAAACGDDGTTPSGNDAGQDTGVADAGPQDMGEVDLDMTVVPDQGIDTGVDSGADMGTSIRTLSDYLKCDSDIDCPVGLGTCIKSIPLNRLASDGTNQVLVSELFDNVAAGEGVCTSTCTDSPAICNSLSVNGAELDPEPFECQLVWVDVAPYPDRSPSELPFTDLDESEQAKGPAFGAICRPPFGLDADVADDLCAACEGAADCGAGTQCWDFQTGQLSAGVGTCVAECGTDSDCPTGFDCSLSGPGGQNFCRPIADTCGPCRDRDGDGFGDGRCGTLDTVTAHDCDDFESLAYLKPADPNHAFPATCGLQDFNCNGLNDEGEQIGTAEFGGEHCTACGDDTCNGRWTNGDKTCATDGSGDAFCGVTCDAGFADCDNDPTNGCEVQGNGITYYLDNDGDGFGQTNSPITECGTTPPVGYALEPGDCDDGYGQTYPGAPEICDGEVNDCDKRPGTADQGFNVGAACSPGLGVCRRSGTVRCTRTINTPTCSVVADPSAASTEVCDLLGQDEDCDGFVNEGFGVGAPCTAGLGICETAGTTQCSGTASVTECVATNPITPGVEACNYLDDDCDGDTDEGFATTLQWNDTDMDGSGDPAAPLDVCNFDLPYMNYVGNDGDCAPSNPTIYESSKESDLCIQDRDGDGYGDSNAGAIMSPAVAGTDCNDDVTTGPAINPDAHEICNFEAGNAPIDDDCDMVANEGCPTAITVSSLQSDRQLVPALPSPGTSVSPITFVRECPPGAAVAKVEFLRYEGSAEWFYGAVVHCAYVTLVEDGVSLKFTTLERLPTLTLTGHPLAGGAAQKLDLSCDETNRYAVRQMGASRESAIGFVSQATFNCGQVGINTPDPVEGDTVSSVEFGALQPRISVGVSYPGFNESPCPDGKVVTGLEFVGDKFSSASNERWLRSISPVCRSISMTTIPQ